MAAVTAPVCGAPWRWWVCAGGCRRRRRRRRPRRWLQANHRWATRRVTATTTTTLNGVVRLEACQAGGGRAAFRVFCALSAAVAAPSLRAGLSTTLDSQTPQRVAPAPSRRGTGTKAPSRCGGDSHRQTVRRTAECVLQRRCRGVWTYRRAATLSWAAVQRRTAAACQRRTWI